MKNLNIFFKEIRVHRSKTTANLQNIKTYSLTIIRTDLRKLVVLGP